MGDTPKQESKIALYAGLAVQAAGIVWWASNLSSEVQHNDFQIQMMGRDVAKNSDFVEKWPSGKWGSGELPSDTRQDLHISELQKQVSKLTEDLYTLKGTAGE
tara:strand:+ start:2143 stop:2451 length:309 start_codon:yes stop_codon:yes gene_type:complete